MAYDHKEIEKNAQDKWAGLDLYHTDLTDARKEPYYLLVEFPYPSGDLHIGHWYAFSVTDIFARILRLKGKNVLFPIGFDAFGLPAENAAIKHGVNPKEWTYANIDRMRTQLKSMGASYDWSKEVIASDPSYYQWTQWLFTKMFEHKLAERREASVKWCPKDQTVLANEQVVDGKCERCGTEVEDKRLTQWFLKITDYAERLLTGLDNLPWREEIKDAQRAWIGKKEGINIIYKVADTSEEIICFTTRPDTNFGATFVVLAPEHQFVQKIISGDLISSEKESVTRYAEETSKKTELERQQDEKTKTGVFTGFYAINNLNGAKMPIWISDFVLAGFGTGAVVGVPGHDLRDFDFAQKFNIPIIRVVIGSDSDNSEIVSRDQVQEASGTMVNSDFLNGLDIHDATTKIMDHIEENGWGQRVKNYRIRDWLVSRQRYWGCPIPIVYDPEGNPHAIPSEHLPWILPTDVDFKPTGKAPLASSVELKERVTKIFGDGWTPEYDTLDTFVDSSWYFLRYFDANDSHNFSDASLMKKWLPVNRYSGGSEHTTMHVLYARFFTKALYDLALVPVDEPFIERFNRGLIMGPDGQKMSKSKGNVLNPDEFVAKYGADAVRIYLAFIGPYNEPGSYPWNLDGVTAMRKFLDRVERLSDMVDTNAESSDKLMQMVARTSEKVAEGCDRFKFNTAISALMILVNELETLAVIPEREYSQFIIMLSPFAPHLSEYLWERLGQENSVHQQTWPQITAATATECVIVVQVNGKRRGNITLPVDATEEEARASAASVPAVATAISGREPRKVVYVAGRIINFVV